MDEGGRFLGREEREGGREKGGGEKKGMIKCCAFLLPSPS